MSNSLEGRWEGLMYDIEGYSARVELDLDKQGNGKFSFSLNGDHCPGEPRYGEVHTKLSREGAVTMDVRGKEVPPIHFDGRLHPVRVHAKAAITGTYSDPSVKEPRGGVAIFWLYANQ